MRIGVFSSNESGLKEAFDRYKHISNELEFVTQEGANPKNINNYIKAFFETEREEDDNIKHSVNDEETKIKIAIKPLHIIDENIEEKVEIFFAKRVLGLLNEESGEYFWSLGKYFWLVNLVKINPEISNELDNNNHLDISITTEEINEMGNDYTDNNQVENYEIILDNDYKIKRFINTTSGNIIDSEIVNKLISLDESQINHFVDQYILSRIICQKYLQKEDFDISKTEIALNSFNKHIKFESIKYLFKTYSEKSKIDAKINSKEDVYELLKEFYHKNFHNILDVYIGRVDYTDEEKGNVKFESVSPEKVVRKEEIDIKILKDNNLAENSFFEFTIHETDIGGVATHIQPI